MAAKRRKGKRSPRDEVKRETCASGGTIHGTTDNKTTQVQVPTVEHQVKKKIQAIENSLHAIDPKKVDNKAPEGLLQQVVNSTPMKLVDIQALASSKTTDDATRNMIVKEVGRLAGLFFKAATLVESTINTGAEKEADLLRPSTSKCNNVSGDVFYCEISGIN